MREELIRVLNNKLNDINKNIDSLVELNKKIDAENEKLSYATRILNGFKDGEEYNIMNFARLSKDDFNKVVSIVDNEASKVFGTSNCNYDGLIYLINGINSGVSLSLTEEQKSGIQYLINGLSDKEEEYQAIIDGLLLVKSRFPISDVDVLNSEKEKYTNIVERVEKEEYVSETDKICEAMNFSELTKEEIVNLLKYLLEYNAKIYDTKKNVVEKPKENDFPQVELPFEEETHVQEEVKEENKEEFTFKPFASIDLENVSYTDEGNSTSIVSEFNKEDNELPLYSGENELQNVSEIKNDYQEEEKKEENEEITFEAPSFILPEEQEEQENVEEVVLPPYEEPKEGEKEDSSILEINSVGEEHTEEMIVPEVSEEESIPEIQPAVEIDINNVDDDFKDVAEGSDYEEYNVDDKTSNRELQRLFSEFELNDLEVTDDLLLGNALNYRKVLEVLKKHNLLDKVKDNHELLKEMLLSSGEEEINEVLKIIKEELSVDDEDYEITLNIVLKTMPTVFIKDHGNYDNFVKNVAFLKKNSINLISLFDFSKEVLIADNNLLVDNYNLVKKYDINVDYKNAKYMLLLNNIAERLDYYVESSYLDQTKKEMFDGITYINNYAVKLNSVEAETIKRLRFASSNGKKIFGSKPNSLSGEITNLKVNVLELDDSYRSSFFDNEFNGLTEDETREYIKLVRNSSNVGNYSDELEKLDSYRKGLRYDFNGILVSYNKVFRNYNILRSYGIDSNKALHFAICYNLVITKDEYEKLRSLIEELGGAL